MTYILTGDCLAVMPTLEAESVDAIVSDPPYGLAFMGKAWDHGVPGPEFWREAFRVAKPGAHLVAFGGTRTYHRLTCAIEDAGWEIRDCLSWLYGSGFPKSHNGPWGGTALKPAWEPIILARKPLTGTVASNVAQHGTGALNVDGCRIGTGEQIAAHHGTRNPRTAMGDGWHDSYKSGDAGKVVQTLGRWPANVCLDEEAAAMLDAQSGERKSQGGKAFTRDGFTPADNSRKAIGYGDSGGASRFFFVEEGQCDNASDAVLTSSHGEQVADSAPNLASPSRSPVPLPVGRESTADCTACTPRQSLALSVEAKDSTDTTPTTPTCCGSCGSALPAIAASTNPVSAEAVADASDPVSGTRFLYTAKASRREREAGLEGMPKEMRHFFQTGNGASGKPSSLEIAKTKNPKPYANWHPTVKPIALMRWLCRLVTPKGGLILDPFTGSGTTGCAAVLEGFRFVGIEREPEYAAIAEKRIAHWAGQVDEPTLFD